jgi:hypothetical protein
MIAALIGNAVSASSQSTKSQKPVADEQWANFASAIPGAMILLTLSSGETLQGRLVKPVDHELVVLKDITRQKTSEYEVTSGITLRLDSDGSKTYRRLDISSIKASPTRT